MNQDPIERLQARYSGGGFKPHQWNYRDAEVDSGWRITGHPLNAIIDNGRCNLGHEWDEGFNADCGLCAAVRDAMDFILREGGTLGGDSI